MKNSIPDKILRTNPQETIGWITKQDKIYQIYCGDCWVVNKWLKKNPDIEVANILASANEYGEIITVVYRVDVEVDNNEQ